MKEDQSGGETGVTGHYRVEYEDRLSNHADGFSMALQRALKKAEKQGLIRLDGQYDAEVRFSVGIEFTNPPWIGDYRVWIDPKERP